MEEADARMTTEQLKEFAEALSILSAKSSVLKERDELRALMEENLQAEEVRLFTLLDVYTFMLTLRSRIPSPPRVLLPNVSGLCLPRLTNNSKPTTPVLVLPSR